MPLPSCCSHDGWLVPYEIRVRTLSHVVAGFLCRLLLLLRFPLLNHPYQINHIPQMLCHASAHRWGHSQGRVDTNEIVIHEVRRDLPASDRRNIPLARPNAPENAPHRNTDEARVLPRGAPCRPKPHAPIRTHRPPARLRSERQRPGKTPCTVENAPHRNTDEAPVPHASAPCRPKPHAPIRTHRPPARLRSESQRPGKTPCTVENAPHRNTDAARVPHADAPCRPKPHAPIRTHSPPARLRSERQRPGEDPMHRGKCPTSQHRRGPSSPRGRTPPPKPHAPIRTPSPPARLHSESQRPGETPCTVENAPHRNTVAARVPHADAPRRQNPMHLFAPTARPPACTAKASALARPHAPWKMPHIAAPSRPEFPTRTHPAAKTPCTYSHPQSARPPAQRSQRPGETPCTVKMPHIAAPPRPEFPTRTHPAAKTPCTY